MITSKVPTSSWLYPEELPEVVARLVELGLIKWDNERGLPLKSGDLTDIYVDIRSARNSPEATRYVAELYQMPLSRLKSCLFGEVPDAVSGIAGHLSAISGIPYLTFRERPKEGRVANATVIGNPAKDVETVDFLDDVITDGASKKAPYHEAVKNGLKPRSLIVLVDRQQGWRKYFVSEGINLPVWPAMTLHDVRRELVLSGRMQRCDPASEAANRLIVALDGKSWDEILPLIDKLRTTGCILKVNDLLFGQGIEHLLPELSVYGRVMADLKAHDIPKTVENICRRLRECPPWAVTVHASGSGAMVRAARLGLGDALTKVLAVTVLTSIDPDTCEEIYARQPMEQVLKLAKIAMDAGADGLVCSPEEVAELRKLYPEAEIATPGIRSAGVGADDQARIATPVVAIKNGSSHLVMGREILDDPNPVSAVHRVLQEINT